VTQLPLPSSPTSGLSSSPRSGASVGLLVFTTLLLCGDGLPSAHAQTRVACLGEQTTHSFHRENDPEYPQLMGEMLDPDFTIDADAVALLGGGFLTGGGSRFRVGNFGHPRGTVLDHDQENPKSTLRSEELKLAEKFAPDIVVLGPFGDHELLAGVSMDGFKHDLGILLDRIAAFAHQPTILVALPLPRGGKDEDDNYRRIRNETAEVATARGLPTLDLWTAFRGQTELFQDGSHLTPAGRRELARLVGRAVTAMANRNVTAGHPGAAQ